MLALAANVGVSTAKIGVAVVTGSTVMAAEGAHSLADVGNELLLLLAQRRSNRPADDHHPFGYGRDAYFWSLIAAVGVFVGGAVFSLRDGLVELVHPGGATSFAAAYVVLGVSVVLDSASLLQAVRQLGSEARVLRRDFLEHVALTSDPGVRAVFAEDLAAVAGDLIAGTAIALHQVLGSSAPEGVGAVVIGLLVIAVAVQLAGRNRDFLLGEQAPPAMQAQVRDFLTARAGVVAVRELLVTYVGPRRVWVLTRVDVADSLRGDEVEDLARRIESELQQLSVFIQRVDVVPVGAGPVAR